MRDALVAERQALLEGLQQIPFLEPYPSHANFVLCKVRGFLPKGLAHLLDITNLLDWHCFLMQEVASRALAYAFHAAHAYGDSHSRKQRWEH